MAMGKLVARCVPFSEREARMQRLSSPDAPAGMDYTLDGVFTPGKIGAWRFDKRSYASGPPPRKLGEPPKGMTNELVRAVVHMHAVRRARRSASDGWLPHTAVLQPS